jgi:hypothetical protein|tara:strand:- start:965 stop:1387 length:423 start_codon:yes stop_codon:yes gene_type:complete
MAVQVREFTYTGTSEMFITGQRYTIKKIIQATGLTDNVIRNRLQYGNEFDDSMLLPRDSRPKTLKKRSVAQKAHRATIIKNAVITETEYVLRFKPAAMAKVKIWLKDAIKKPVDFWLEIDNLLLSQIIKVAVNYKAKPDE